MSGFLSRPLRDALNEGNPNKVGSANQVARLGDALAGGKRYVRDDTIATAPAHVLVLPAGQKAARLLGGFIIAGAAGVGPIDVVPEDAVLASGQAQVTADGNILFLAADAVTEAEIEYETPEQAEVTVDVAVTPGTGIGLLTPRAGVRLLAAEALTGTVTGIAAIQPRAAGQAGLAAGQAALTADGESVEFLIADAVTSARVTFQPQPGFGPTPDDAATRVDVDANI